MLAQHTAVLTQLSEPSLVESQDLATLLTATNSPLTLTSTVLRL